MADLWLHVFSGDLLKFAEEFREECLKTFLKHKLFAASKDAICVVLDQGTKTKAEFLMQGIDKKIPKGWALHAEGDNEKLISPKSLEAKKEMTSLPTSPSMQNLHFLIQHPLHFLYTKCGQTYGKTVGNPALPVYLEWGAAEGRLFICCPDVNEIANEFITNAGEGYELASPLWETPIGTTVVAEADKDLWSVEDALLYQAKLMPVESLSIN